MELKRNTLVIVGMHVHLIPIAVVSVRFSNCPEGLLSYTSVLMQKDHLYLMPRLPFPFFVFGWVKGGSFEGLQT